MDEPHRIINKFVFLNLWSICTCKSEEIPGSDLAKYGY